MDRRHPVGHKSGFEAQAKAKQLLDFAKPSLGQSYPQRCPQPDDANPLGTPLSIADVAKLVGCSKWTIRRKYLPLGLPHFRVGSTGKLLFYKKQVIRWLIRRQKGEM